MGDAAHSSGDAISLELAKLVHAGLATPADMVGCSDHDILQLEHQVGRALPLLYKLFLKRAGRGAGRFLEGSDFLYPAPCSLHRTAQHVLDESGTQWTLDSNNFVFAGHQGYEFLMFELGLGDDPPIAFLTEGGLPRTVFPSFSAWLSKCVDDEIAAFRALKKRR